MLVTTTFFANLKKIVSSVCLLLIFSFIYLSGHAQPLTMKITKKYLNIPVEEDARRKLIDISVKGVSKRQFGIQLAEGAIGYWTFIDVSEFKGQTITLSCPVGSAGLKRIYQDDKINGSDSLYRESNRPQFHFSTKRGWTNDVNGPIFYNGEYHMFWQAFPFGVDADVAFMYWGHATSKDLLHWEELDPALMLDTLGSAWSGSAVIDHNNDGGWGKDALVVYYTSYDWVSHEQVQCIAYSTDNAKTFTRYKGNPVISSHIEVASQDTRDPKVLWYEPTRQWVLVLFEKDGMSFYNSTDMKTWKKQSHFNSLFECPDFFQLPVDGNENNKKWVLHGGSSTYYVGSFDGKTFTPETEKLEYAEGKGETDDILYAAQSFENMPDNRRVQIAWGRIKQEGMPFTNMMLFPTEFSLKKTTTGLKLYAKPIKEIEALHKTKREWTNLSPTDANKELNSINPGPLHVKMKFSLLPGHKLNLRYQGNEILTILPTELTSKENEMEILIDKTVAEIFINGGERYILKNLGRKLNDKSLEFDSENYGPELSLLQVYEMKSIWRNE